MLRRRRLQLLERGCLVGRPARKASDGEARAVAVAHSEQSLVELTKEPGTITVLPQNLHFCIGVPSKSSGAEHDAHSKVSVITKSGV